MSINSCTFIGNLGADPDVRKMNNGDPMVKLSVACTETWKKDGQKQGRTTWVPVVIYNEHHARYAERYLKKGSKVYVCGAFTVRKWQDRDGNDKYATEIVINRFKGELQGLGGAGEKPDDGSGGYSKGGYRGSNDERQRADDLDDSIPF